MKTYRFFLMHVGLLLCLYLFSSPARATKAVDTPRASSDAMFANEPTTITITAQVAVDPALLVHSVNLVSLNSQGQITGVVALMYDDGTHGDALKGDGTFTAQMTLNPSQVADQRFAVTVAYKGSLQRIKSPVLIIAVVKRPSDTEINTALTIPITGANYFQSQKTLFGEKTARANLVTFLLSQPGVAKASVGPDGYTIGITFTSGLQSVIFTSPDGTDGNLGYATKPLSHPHPLKYFRRQSIAPHQFKFMSDSAISSVNFTGNAKAIVLAPFYDAFVKATGSDGALSVAQSLSRGCGGQPAFLPNGAADINSFRTLRQYGVVYIHTHGGVFPGGIVVLSTSEQTIPRNQNNPHLIDWQRKLIIPGTNSSYPGKEFWNITPAFVDANAGGGYLKSLVCLCACEGVANDTLWNAFQRHGVQCLFGFDATVSTDFDNQIGVSLFNVLSDPHKAATDRTAQMAYDNLTTTVDPAMSDGKHAVFQIKGDGNLALVTDPVINGDFEAGDFTGWVTDTAIGYNKTPFLEDLDGRYAARIGRWDQPYMNGNGFLGAGIPGAEPSGQDYIYQDVTLPNGITSLTLNFDYDVKTYDGANYDWFDAAVFDASTGERLMTLVNHKGGIIAGSPSNWGLFYTTGRQHVTADLTAFKGRRIRLFFGDTQDGFGDQCTSYIDNVSIKCQD